MDGVHFKTDGPTSLTLDERHGPVVLTTWDGPPSLPLVTWNVEWMLEHIESLRPAQGVLVMIHDATHLSGRPNAATRRKVAETAFDRGILLADIIVVTSRVVRGAMTAVNWLRGGANNMVVVNTMEEALEAAASVLERADRSLPESLRGGYMAPKATPSAAG